MRKALVSQPECAPSIPPHRLDWRPIQGSDMGQQLSSVARGLQCWAPECRAREQSVDPVLGAPRGLRRGQKVAIHALTGHLMLKTEPAIAVLPTGAGKTDVAILLPYFLGAKGSWWLFRATLFAVKWQFDSKRYLS
jgi:hypothetical protein